MLTFDDVYQVPLGRLEDAADRWAEMRRKLDVLAEDAHRKMVLESRAEDWRGLNAEVTKPFIDKTAKEFTDAAKAAGGIHAILRDGHRTFKKAQDELKRIVEIDAPAQGFVVKADGSVEARHPVAEDKGSRDDPAFDAARRKEAAGIAALRRRIDAVVENCIDADTACVLALRANVTDDPHDFNAPKYLSLDAEEAQRAVDLARKGRNLTHAELEQLNELLADNRKAGEFSRIFYDRLGPEGALRFFGELAADTRDEERLTDVRALQKNLGLNLANATQSNAEWASDWSAEMRRLGTERVSLPSRPDGTGPYGYQLLGGLLRHGDYDRKFLVPIAEHITQLHAREPDLFKPDRMLMGPGNHGTYNPSGTNGYGFDPVIPMLEALGHSPEAAKEFFSAGPTAYERDGSVGGTLELGASDNYLDYFADKKYASFADHVGSDAKNAKDYMPDALGHALEAATLGHAWDDPRPVLHRDETTAGIMKNVVDTYGDAEFVKKHQSALADSLGVMGAGYVEDLKWALSDNDPNAVHAPDVEGESLKEAAAISARHPEFGRDAAAHFLSVLGQHPDAYATMTMADRLHTASMLEAQVGPDGRIDEPAAREAARTGAQLQGLLDDSRAEQIKAEGEKAIEDYEKAQEEKAAWVELGVGTAVAAGVAFVPPVAATAGAAAILVPLAVDTVSGTMETLAGVVVGDWSEKSVEEYKDATEDKADGDREAVYTAGRHSAESPMRHFLDVRGEQVGGALRQDLIEAVDIGYATGNSFAGQIGNGPETG
ncbi:hypothetical protein ACFFSH_00260 [Streptomyces filamentosus]|uniref:AG2 protein n=1 Tax=Streptomyces filamentosus TaxID=67294 RepID=A0A919EMI9_STRFL|nr:hypothetical protein [Streptomyces filamentosus]GHF99233.1 hypothetical protein GCM10017667_32640 [Streptomyces filamentosus]